MKTKTNDDIIHVRLLPDLAIVLTKSLKNLQNNGVFNHDESANHHDVDLIGIVNDAIMAATLRRIRGEKP